MALLVSWTRIALRRRWRTGALPEVAAPATFHENGVGLDGELQPTVRTAVPADAAIMRTIGRTAWRVAADITPLVYRPPGVLRALVLVAPPAMLASNLLAAVPAIADLQRRE